MLLAVVQNVCRLFCGTHACVIVYLYLYLYFQMCNKHAPTLNCGTHARVIVRPHSRKKDRKSCESEASDLSIRRGTNKRARPPALARSTLLLFTEQKWGRPSSALLHCLSTLLSYERHPCTLPKPFQTPLFNFISKFKLNLFWFVTFPWYVCQKLLNVKLEKYESVKTVKVQNFKALN